MGGHRLEELTGVVLAGGQARRMGHVNKALMTVGGAAVIDRILDRLSETCAHVMVIANDPAPYTERGVPIFPDAMPGHGALGGLHSALLNAPTPNVFVCGCDMPFISPPLIRALAARIGTQDAAVPRDGYGLQPLHAVYARRIAPLVPPFLVRGELRLERFITGLDAAILPPQETATYAAEAEIFFNVNTPDDLEQAREKARPL
ncbi:molybdenum cofactor guanylyltransferase [Aquabacter cavernae]|uniref:molybdenum cofactor guanylyltransferase n=1 Tax=Aquabacter cavernae TaxID=2496029 RepID=UPI000F8F0E0C|nr:molybdenum cofactor guanylyltransferase [Aquabacter cavernae]